MDLSMDEMARSEVSPLGQGRRILAAAPWEAYLLSVSGFPIPEPERAHILQFVAALADVLESVHAFRSVVFLQANHLHLDDAYQRFQRNARAWMPELGVGIWPDRGPIRPWTRDEFEQLEPCDEMRSVIDQVFRITAPAPERRNAWTSMIGAGTVLLMLTPGSESELLKRANQLLTPLAQHPAFPSFRLHAPLLDIRSVERGEAADLEEWTCGATCYVRESIEDGGVLLLFRPPVDSFLAEIQPAELRLLGRDVGSDT
jgi:hypothetical protein